MAALIDLVKSRFGDAVLETDERLGEETVVVARDALPEICRALRDDPETAFDFLTDLTAVDLHGRTPRFEIVAHLFSLSKRHRLRLKVRVDEAEPSAPTLSGVWKNANWLEREIYDMFGVRFEGHPDLRRILLYPEFVGYPLRKDYPVNKRQPLIPERDPVENPWPARTFAR
jgi:NADH-quinone oxidoreductase subunit C